MIIRDNIKRSYIDFIWNKLSYDKVIKNKIYNPLTNESALYII